MHGSPSSPPTPPVPDALTVAVAEPALILGATGLLPQVLALVMGLFGHGTDIGQLFAFGYASLILSFVGGMWWGLAMHRPDRQGGMAAMAVVPSLVAAALVLLAVARALTLGWALVALGSAVMLTLLVDRRLVDDGLAPAGWMALRVPLSLSLGVLTIATGVAG